MIWGCAYRSMIYMSQESNLFLPLYLALIRLLLEHCVLFWSLHLALRDIDNIFQLESHTLLAHSNVY